MQNLFRRNEMQKQIPGISRSTQGNQCSIFDAVNLNIINLISYVRGNLLNVTFPICGKECNFCPT